MLRYMRLYLYFVRFSLSRAMEFRFDFWFRIVMDSMYYAVNIGFFLIVFDHTDIIAEWSREQCMVFVGVYLVIDALQMTFFSNNLWILPQLVNKGDLDYYLLRPISSLFFVSLRDFAVNSFINILIASAILIGSIAKLPTPITFLQASLFPVYLFLGLMIHFLLNLLSIIPVFWIHSAKGMQNVFWILNKMGERPDRVYTGWTRRILVTILPLGIMSSFPARMIVEPLDFGIALHGAVVTGGLFITTLFVWSKALRAYSSASS